MECGNKNGREKILSTEKKALLTPKINLYVKLFWILLTIAVKALLSLKKRRNSSVRTT